MIESENEKERKGAHTKDGTESAKEESEMYARQKCKTRQQCTTQCTTQCTRVSNVRRVSKFETGALTTYN